MGQRTNGSKKTSFLEHGASTIVATVHRRDALFVVSTIYEDFSAVVSSRRADSESFEAFK